MKDLDLYQRAASDPAFRRAKLDELRYFKSVGAGLIWFSAILGVAISIYGALTSGEWDKGSALLFMTFLCASTYHGCSVRIAALQALETRRA